jgi:hypothetical protein
MQYTLDQKKALRVRLEDPLLMDALTEALRSVHLEKRDATTLEGAAMAYSYTQGAGKLLENLFRNCESSKSIGLTPRKLKHTQQ